MHLYAKVLGMPTLPTIVLQHPLYWYSVPGLLKHWFDKVLARGFAYGAGGRELVGKRWVPQVVQM